MQGRQWGHVFDGAVLMRCERAGTHRASAAAHRPLHLQNRGTLEVVT